MIQPADVNSFQFWGDITLQCIKKAIKKLFFRDLYVLHPSKLCYILVSKRKAQISMFEAKLELADVQGNLLQFFYSSTINCSFERILLTVQPPFFAENRRGGSFFCPFCLTNAFFTVKQFKICGGRLILFSPKIASF